MKKLHTVNRFKHAYSRSSSLVVLLGWAWLAGAPNTALADPASPTPAVTQKAARPSIQIEFDAGDGADYLYVRSKGGELKAPRIAASSKAFLFTFKNASARGTEIRPESARLRSIRVRHHQGEVGVRLVQKGEITSSLRKHVSYKRIYGGYKITVRHGDLAPTPAAETANETPVTSTSLEATKARAKQLAQLLGGRQAPPATKATSSSTPQPAVTPSEPTRSAAPQAKVQPTPPQQEVTAKASEKQPTPSIAAKPTDILDEPLGFLNTSDHASPGSQPGHETSTDHGENHGEETHSGSDQALALTLLLGLFGTTALLFFWLKNNAKGNKQSAGLEVMERVQVAPRQALLRVRVDQRELLLGQSEGGIQLLTELGPGTQGTRLLNAPSSPTNTVVPPAKATVTSAETAPGPNSWFYGGESNPGPGHGAAEVKRIDAFKNRLSAAINAEHGRAGTGSSEQRGDNEHSEHHAHLRKIVLEHEAADAELKDRRSA